MNANAKQVGGTHYKGMPIEHWDLVAIFDWDYFQARSIAYTMRWREKGGIADLKKSIHFLEKYIEVEELKTGGRHVEALLILALEKERERLSKKDAVEHSADEEEMGPIVQREVTFNPTDKPLQDGFKVVDERVYPAELNLADMDADSLRDGIIKRRGPEPQCDVRKGRSVDDDNLNRPAGLADDPSGQHAHQAHPWNAPSA